MLFRSVCLKCIFDKLRHTLIPQLSIILFNFPWGINKVFLKLIELNHNISVYQKRYLDEAEREKLQYAQELKEYQETEAYQITSAKINDKRIKKGNS